MTSNITEPDQAKLGHGLKARLFLMKNHDEAYQVWHQAGVRERICVHLDAHDDMGWIPEETPTCIANFICQALKESLVREVFWVVPDQTWQSPRHLNPVLLRLKKIIKSYPGDHGRIKVDPREISTQVLGKPLRVCTLANLPPFTEEVLLDIDVDYFLLPRAGYRSDSPPRLPWCWPAELVARLKAGKLRGDLVTIAYSVEGGYTPLKWKYLGDELALRLQHPGQGHPGLQGMEMMRTAALAACRGELALAEEKYLAAQEALPDSAAPPYHLAFLFLEMGRPIPAQESYQRALALDPSYRTPYNSAGLWYYSGGEFQKAKLEFRRTLALDPDDPYAHLGLGKVACKERRWPEAEAWLRKTAALREDLLDAYRALGEALTAQGRQSEAIAAYENSLKLALAGHKPLGSPIASYIEDDRLIDPEHFQIFAHLGRLYEEQGDLTKAINHYRLGLGGGRRGVVLHSCLARLYRKQHQWQQFAQEMVRAAKMIPIDLTRAGRWLYLGLRRTFRTAYNILTMS